MNTELKILELADYYKKFEIEGAEAYLIINKKIEKYQCMFGFLKLLNDFEITKKLFKLLEEEAVRLGYDEIVGPINYCTWLTYRLALNYFDKKYYPDCDNEEYYPEFLNQLGYEILHTYRSANITIDNPLYNVGKEVYNQKLNEGFEFKLYEKDDMYKVNREIYDVSIDAFSDAYLYSKIPFEYFENVYLAWTKNLDSGLYMAYYEGEPVGYVYGYLNPLGNEFISKTTAVKKDFQKNKLYIALSYLGYEYMKEKGFNETMFLFQCEQKSTFKKFDKNFESNEKKYGVFVKKLKLR